MINLSIADKVHGVIGNFRQKLKKNRGGGGFEYFLARNFSKFEDEGRS